MTGITFRFEDMSSPEGEYEVWILAWYVRLLYFVWFLGVLETTLSGEEWELRLRR